MCFDFEGPDLLIIDDLEAKECLEIESVLLEDLDVDPFVETLNLPVFLVKEFILYCYLCLKVN